MMHTLMFHTIKAQNVFCFGPDGIEVHFKDCDNVTQIKGVNHDAPWTSAGPASNASGKSSIAELLSVGLYGRTIRKPTKNTMRDILNVSADKGFVEVLWNDFRLVRTYKRQKSGSVSMTLELWKSAQHIWDDTSLLSKAKKPQEEIEKELKLTHHAFCNVIIFDDSNSYAFLEAEAKDKRAIIENLLDLEQYRTYHKNCKEIIKGIKGEIAQKTASYQLISDVVREHESRIESLRLQDSQWKKSVEINRATNRLQLETLRKALQDLAAPAGPSEYDLAQAKIVEHQAKLADLVVKKEKYDGLIKQGWTKVVAARAEKDRVHGDIASKEIAKRGAEQSVISAARMIESLEKLEPGTTCVTCHGKVDAKNFQQTLSNCTKLRQQHQATVDSIEAELTALRTDLTAKASVLKTMEATVQKGETEMRAVDASLASSRNEIARLSQIVPTDNEKQKAALQTKIIQAEATVTATEAASTSPYLAMIDTTQKELATKKDALEAASCDLKRAEEELPYFEYCLEAFGDDGIRRDVVDRIIPSFNERLAYWLDMLTGNVLKVEFDAAFEDTMTRSGNPVNYSNLSNGEVQKTNLSINRSFAYAQMINSGCFPNIVFLDEITGGGIDKASCPLVYNMIMALAEEQKVFVTTHNDTLVQLLEGCRTMTVVKRNDVSRLE